MASNPGLGIADIACIVIVLLISAAIGIFFRFSGGRQKTTKEFLMGGGAMSPFPVVFSLIVTYISAVMMLGVPPEVYHFGLYRMLAYLSSTVSSILSAYLFLPVYFQMGDSVSVYAYLERRFGTLTRKISSILFILQTVFCMAVVLYAPALALSEVTGITDVHISIITIGGICTLYCCLGGMKAVLWTDFFQAIVMYICVFAILVQGILLARSIPDAFQKIHDRPYNFFSFDPSVRYTVWNTVSYGFLFGLCNYGCNQAQIQRMLSVKSLKVSQRAVIASVPLAVIFITVNFFIGIVMLANYEKNPFRTCLIKKSDQLVPHFIMHSLTAYPGLAGLCVAGIFSGALSTVSSSVNSLAAVTMEDFVRPYFGTTRKIADGLSAILVKVFACAYGILGIVCAFAVGKAGLVDTFTVVFGTISGPVLGLFTLGMLTVSANQKGVLSGLVSGILITLSFGIAAFKNMILCDYGCENTEDDTTNINNVTSSYSSNYSRIDITSVAADINNFTSSYFSNYSSIDVTSVTTSFTGDVINYTTDTIDTSTYINATTGIPGGGCEKKDWLSLMWLLGIGFGATTVLGYIASFLENRYGSAGKTTDVDPALLSPLIRKWIAKPLPQNPQDEAEEHVKLNGFSEA